MRNDDVRSIAEDIMEYLRRHPNASDSFDGVALWWLLQQAIERDMDLVKQALEQLAREGRIAKSQNANNETIYSLPRSDPDRRV